MSKTKKTDYSHFEKALENAHKAAREACAKELDHMNRLDCGFAWVVVTDRAFMGWCRKQAKLYREKAEAAPADSNERSAFYALARSFGDKHHAAGWCFWKPGNFIGQSITGHEAGARAFRDSLAHELGIYVEMGSRLD